MSSFWGHNFLTTESIDKLCTFFELADDNLFVLLSVDNRVGIFDVNPFTAPILLAPVEGWGMGSGQLVGARTGIIYIYSKQNNLSR